MHWVPISCVHEYIIIRALASAAVAWTPTQTKPVNVDAARGLRPAFECMRKVNELRGVSKTMIMPTFTSTTTPSSYSHIIAIVFVA